MKLRPKMSDLTDEERDPITTAEIRRGYIGEPPHFMDERVGQEFDRWLARHDAEVAHKVAARVINISRGRRFDGYRYVEKTLDEVLDDVRTAFPAPTTPEGQNNEADASFDRPS
jgi:hypothetical protein